MRCVQINRGVQEGQVQNDYSPQNSGDTAEEKCEQSQGSAKETPVLVSVCLIWHDLLIILPYFCP